MKKKYLSLLFLLLSSVAFSQTLKINEISIANTSQQLDPNYDYKGWIEFYNPTTAAIDLKNLYFSDERGNPLKFKLYQNRLVNAGAFNVIWLNDEIRNVNYKFIDTDNDGGFLSVANANGDILDSITYVKQYPNVSYGRTIDGQNNWAYFLQTSFKKSNNGIGTGTETVATPIFSVPSGFYNSSQQVELYCFTPGSKIYYSLDYSEPDSSKTLYTGTPINITATGTIRAKAYAKGYLDAPSASFTYLINERKPNMPVALLTCDTANLYNDSIGIYCVGTNGTKLLTNGIVANFNQDWTRLAYFEFLDNAKNIVLSQPIGLSISGNQSREYDQKSFEIKAGKKYGKSRFDYQFFENKPALRQKTLVLRNGGQQSISGFLIKDLFNQSLGASLNLDYQDYAPCAVYLNGKYWGLMPIREKSSKDFIYANYNYDDEEDDYDMIDPTRVLAGDDIKFNELETLAETLDMKIDSNYQKVAKLMDIENYIRYMSTEIFLINTDWPSKENMRFFCPKNDDSKFRWILQDLDKGFSYFSKNMLNSFFVSTSTSIHIKLITYLLNNESFKDQYIDNQCLVAGSVFNTQRVNAELDKIVQIFTEENGYNAARWNSNWVNDLASGVSTIRNNTKKIKDKAIYDMKVQLSLSDTLGLKIYSTEPVTPITFNSIEMPALPYDGRYFSDKTLKLSTPLYDNGKKFAYWKITEGTETKQIDSTSITLHLQKSTIATATYQDASDVRRAGLYINEVSANNEIFVDEKFDYEDWIEVYNSSNQPISVSDYYLSNNPDNVELFQFSSDANIIPAHGYGIFWCSGKTSRGAMHTNFKLEKDGGKLFLAKYSTNGINIVDSITYSKHTKRTSFGRSPDGGDQLVSFDKATFKTRNLASNNDIASYKQSPKFTTDLKSQTALNAQLVSVRKINTDLILEKNNDQTMVASIYNLSGIKLKQINTNDRSCSISIQDLTEGIYILKLNNNNQTQTIKFIK